MGRSTPGRQCGTNDRRSKGVCTGRVQGPTARPGDPSRSELGVVEAVGVSPGDTDPPEYECSALLMAPAINYAIIISPNSLYGFTEPRIISVTTIFPHPHDNQAH